MKLRRVSIRLFLAFGDKVLKFRKKPTLSRRIRNAFGEFFYHKGRVANSAGAEQYFHLHPLGVEMVRKLPQHVLYFGQRLRPSLAIQKTFCEQQLDIWIVQLTQNRAKRLDGALDISRGKS